MTFRDKAVMVTGASQGLGAALARTLAARGARVVLVARRVEPLSTLAQEITSAGGEAHVISADIADKFAIHPLVATASELIGPLDVLIHNASTLGPVPLRLLVDTDCEDLERALAVNLVGPFRLSKLVAGSMALRGTGHIVHISSDAAVRAYARWGAYAVTKAAQDHLSRLWAEELAPFGVRVLSVDPGEMDTEMHHVAMPDADRASLAQPSTVAERIAGLILDPRLGSGARVDAQHWEAA
jgi:NAD(P)-dependent dehydrogenase (short-subunit alcohol dehydrogenase family)